MRSGSSGASPSAERGWRASWRRHSTSTCARGRASRAVRSSSAALDELADAVVVQAVVAHRQQHPLRRLAAQLALEALDVFGDHPRRRQVELLQPVPLLAPVARRLPHLHRLVDPRREQRALRREAEVGDGLAVAVHRPQAGAVLPVPNFDDVVDGARVEDVRLHGERAHRLRVLVSSGRRARPRVPQLHHPVQPAGDERKVAISIPHTDPRAPPRVDQLARPIAHCRCPRRVAGEEHALVAVSRPRVQRLAVHLVLVRVERLERRSCATSQQITFLSSQQE